MEPLFLDGKAGPLFAVYHPPTDGAAPRRIAVHCPALAEEMNKSRRMVAMQARAFARNGVGALLFDLYGTGDSAGGFGEATWETWRADVGTALAWAGARCERIWLWGLRAGALLAGSAARTAGEAVERVILWQAVAKGETWLSQFLRLRTAASLFHGGEKESVKDLLGRLLGGASVEAAGYEVAPGLAAGLLASSLADDLVAAARPVHWFEIGATGGLELPPGSQRVVASLRERGVSVSAAVVAGEPFWSTQEIAVAPDLLRITQTVA